MKFALTMGLVALVAAFAMVGPPVLAQDAAPAPDQSKEIAALKQQVAQLSQPKPMSPAEQTKAAQDGYASIFKEANEKAGPGCRAQGGDPIAMVGPDGKASVGCAGMKKQK